MFSRAIAACVACLIAIAAFGAATASAATTVTPSGPGAIGADQLVRDSSVNLAVSHDGTWPDSPLVLTRPFTTAPGYPTTTAGYAAPNFAQSPNFAQDLAWLGTVSGCTGDAKTPLTRVTVTAPGGQQTVQYSAPRAIGGLNFLTGEFPRVSPNPEFGGPGTTSTYRGELPKNVGASPNAKRGVSFSYDLTGKAPGVYTVLTEARDAYKTNSGGSGKPSSCVVGGIRTLQTQTFEYRPWKYTFKDVLGNGSVSMNVNPAEQAWTLGPSTSKIHKGNALFFDLPDGETAPLPSDPQQCVSDPEACLPESATPCDPGAGCEPRLIFVSHTGPEALHGLFDTESGAFIAWAHTDGGTRQRILFSLGKDLDPVYRSTLNTLETEAAKYGVNLAQLLATQIRVRTGEREVKLSLVNGLQIDPSRQPGGVQLVSDATVAAGLILNLYSRTELVGGTGCQLTAADSDPTTAAPDRVKNTADVGYTVERSDLLPSVPRVGPLGDLIGGPIYHIKGDFVGGTGELVNAASAVLGLDTAADEPNGYPAWISPFLSGIRVHSPRSMDFLGTAVFTANEVPLGTTGCITVDVLLGTGVAVFNNPLPVGFGNIAIWDRYPSAEALTAAIDEAVQNVVDEVSANPAVADLLEQIVGALPES